MLSRQAKQHGVAIHVPGSGARGTYENYASSLITELNKLQGLNRLNEREFKAFGNMIPEEKEWFTAQGQAKLEALRQHIHNKRMEEYQRKLGLQMGARPPETPGGGAR